MIGHGVAKPVADCKTLTIWEVFQLSRGVFFGVPPKKNRSAVTVRKTSHIVWVFGGSPKNKTMFFGCAPRFCGVFFEIFRGRRIFFIRCI